MESHITSFQGVKIFAMLLGVHFILETNMDVCHFTI